jgi:hypothetical protein
MDDHSGAAARSDRVTGARSVTEEDLLRVLQQALQSPENPEGALTTKELSRLLGWRLAKLYEAMDLVEHLIEVVDIRQRNRAGRLSVKPAYRLRRPLETEQETELEPRQTGGRG